LRAVMPAGTHASFPRGVVRGHRWCNRSRSACVL